MTSRYIVERALFVVGDQDTGKSTQLRSLFRDHRFGTGGDVPVARNVANTYALSNERRLYLRLTSPHEAGETFDDFADKFTRAMDSHPRGRWNVAGPLQPTGTDQLAAAPEFIERFVRRFAPERVRAAILSPTWRGEYLTDDGHGALVERLRAVEGVEIVTLDARHRTANGLIYADFFDFT